MQVTFTKHAVERMQQRLRIAVPTQVAVNIAPLFTKSHSYVNETNGRLCECWCSNDLTKKVVLVVDTEKRAVVTVYLGGNITGLSTPFVDQAYAKLANKLA
jgi:hypothetical protein